MSFPHNLSQSIMAALCVVVGSEWAAVKVGDGIERSEPQTQSPFKKLNLKLAVITCQHHSIPTLSNPVWSNPISFNKV